MRTSCFSNKIFTLLFSNFCVTPSMFQHNSENVKLKSLKEYCELAPRQKTGSDQQLLHQL